MTQQPLLQVHNVSKIFGATRALSDANLEIHAGQIHSLLGRNGAGKSTLVNIIAGIYPPSDGAVLFEGQDLRTLNIFSRQELGIRLVPQHENSFPHLTVAENIFTGLLPTRHGLVDWKEINRIAAEELGAYGLHVDPRAKVSELSSIDARKLNIIRAMHSGAKLIILDEPTTALTNRERAELFEFVRDLRAMGTAFIFISHYLGEVLELSDSISVLRDGRMYPVENRAEATEARLATLVAGEDVELSQRHRDEAPGPEATYVVVHGLASEGLQDVSIDIRRGEILGVIGFPGSGAREFCRTLFGISKVTAGSIVADGKELHLSSPAEAIRQGIAYISFDRHREGIMPTFDVNENIGISSQAGKLRRAFGFIDLALQKSLSNQYRDALKIRTNSIDDDINSLSGGNQQKVIVSRLLNTDPRLLILDEPTVGIDIKSREEIIGTVLELTRGGMSAIYLTNDYEELLRVADRLVFFDEGRIVTVLDNEGITIEQLTAIRDRAKEGV
ncbi:monosaccharide ABC transporter ATP-binding protein, CUT2 family [Raineyella antarctica]|uniref:Monosaccharide ABC transporter ATP-binding protein, CUT2 family n=1 Tax=Raineyella antarctica TaxID=1577474 RepID=A0A1G6HQC6_9ACTN|nr:sugar ABC transporter ATP-binding protein [Raineyella antarctica]SDB96479.1 monosaccharide ABC transporter ATP-binding protein, CUT2 family [Raineyella antarctica]